MRKRSPEIDLQTRVRGHILEVWLGDPDKKGEESDFVLGIDLAFVPALIRTLSLHVPHTKPNPKKTDKR